MKKEFRINRRFKLVSTAVIVCALFVTSCSGNANIVDSNAANSIELSDADITQSDEFLTETETESTTKTTLPLEEYTFRWEGDENYEFDNFIQKKYGISLAKYITWFGLTDELNDDFTNFVNSRFKTDFEAVPFIKADYFYTYIKIAEVRDFYSEYDYFEIAFLSDSSFSNGVFNNKLVMSYLAENNIPFGYRVPIENMRAIVEDEVYTCNVSKEIFADSKFGNYEDNHIYSNEQLVTAIKNYNAVLTTLAIDQGVKTYKIDENLDLCENYNENLKKYFGADAPQLGQTLSKEQVIKLKGGCYDLSYIPGAVYDATT